MRFPVLRKIFQGCENCTVFAVLYCVSNSKHPGWFPAPLLTSTMVYTPLDAPPGPMMPLQQPSINFKAANYKAQLKGTPNAVAWETGLMGKLGLQGLAERLRTRLPANHQYVDSIDGPPRKVQYLVKPDYSARVNKRPRPGSDNVELKTCLQYPTLAFNQEFPEGKHVWSSFNSPVGRNSAIPGAAVEQWHIANGSYFDSPFKSDFHVSHAFSPHSAWILQIVCILQIKACILGFFGNLRVPGR